MAKKNKIILGEMCMKLRDNGDKILTFQGAVSYIKRKYYDYDIVEFFFEEQPYILEIKYTLTSQKTFNYV